ncbi:MAG: type I-E CRISPR-associated protein Cse2/CasB [Desulfobacterales bacterium]|nr:MAG: type I-E CRISPR-associated protein Cse2/CasB [Desulfobacterales bacterium]
MTDIETRTPAGHVPALAAVLKAEHFPTGERAALKRMALDGPAPLAFHRFVLRHIDSPWQSESWTSEWRALICSLAIQRDGGFDPSKPLGQALAEASFSEHRLERLLAATGETLRSLALRAARQLAAKGIATDWRQLAELLFSRNPEIREAVNRRIARDYYRTV